MRSYMDYPMRSSNMTGGNYGQHPLSIHSPSHHAHPPTYAHHEANRDSATREMQGTNYARHHNHPIIDLTNTSPHHPPGVPFEYSTSHGTDDYYSSATGRHPLLPSFLPPDTSFPNTEGRTSENRNLTLESFGRSEDNPMFIQPRQQQHSHQQADNIYTSWRPSTLPQQVSENHTSSPPDPGPISTILPLESSSPDYYQQRRRNSSNSKNITARKHSRFKSRSRSKHEPPILPPRLGFPASPQKDQSLFLPHTPTDGTRRLQKQPPPSIQHPTTPPYIASHSIPLDGLNKKNDTGHPSCGKVNGFSSNEAELSLTSHDDNNTKWQWKHQPSKTPFTIVDSSSPSYIKQNETLSEESLLFHQIAANFKGDHPWKNVLGEKRRREQDFKGLPLPPTERPGNSSINFVGTDKNKDKSTPEKECLAWEKEPKTQHRPEKVAFKSKKSKIVSRHPKWVAPVTQNNARESTVSNSGSYNKVSKIASAMSQLSNLKKRWNPPPANMKRRGRMNQGKLSKSTNQHENQYEKSPVEEKKRQNCSEMVQGGMDRLESMALNKGACKNEDILESSVQQNNSIITNQEPLVGECEEMDISDEEEEDTVCAKKPTLELKPSATTSTCEEGEIIQNTSLQKNDKELKGRHLPLLNTTGKIDAVSPYPSTSSTIPDGKGTDDASDEQIIKDLYDALPQPEMTMQKPTTLHQKEVNLHENCISNGANANLYKLALDTKDTGNQNIITQEKNVTVAIDDSLNNLQEEKITKFTEDMYIGNGMPKLNLVLTRGNLTSHETEAKRESQMNDTTQYAQDEKKHRADLAVPYLIATNSSYNSTLSIAPKTLNDELIANMNMQQPKSDLLTSSSSMNSSESLAFKKARLAKELNKARIGKAKAELRMAQIKKRDALQAKTIREIDVKDTKSTFRKATCSSTSSNATVQECVDTINVCRVLSSDVNTVTSTKRKAIADVTAFKMSTLMISGITASGMSDKVRVIALKEDEDGCYGHLSNSRRSKKEVPETMGNIHLATSSSRAISCDSAPGAPNKSSSLTLEEQIENSNKRNLDLRLKKIRLQVKMLEKAQATKKMKAECKKPSGLPTNHMASDLSDKKPSTSLTDSTGAVQCTKSKLKSDLKREDEGEKILHTQKQILVGLPVDCEDSLQDEIEAKVSKSKKNVLPGKLDAEQTQDHAAMLDLNNSAFQKKEEMNKLLERQTTLIENINFSREANKELKYEKEVSDLNILVQRQRKMLKYHGYKIGESKTSLERNSEELLKEKEQIVTAEKNLEALLKRRKVLKSMVLSTTTELIDFRRKRGVMFKRLAKKKSK